MKTTMKRQGNDMAEIIISISVDDAVIEARDDDFRKEFAAFLVDQSYAVRMHGESYLQGGFGVREFGSDGARFGYHTRIVRGE
jgi:hypothetical protein